MKENSGTVLGYPNAKFDIYENGTFIKTLATVYSSSKNPLATYTTSAEAEITIKATFAFSCSNSYWKTSS